MFVCWIGRISLAGWKIKDVHFRRGALYVNGRPIQTSSTKIFGKQQTLFRPRKLTWCDNNRIRAQKPNQQKKKLNKVNSFDILLCCSDTCTISIILRRHWDKKGAACSHHQQRPTGPWTFLRCVHSPLCSFCDRLDMRRLLLADTIIRLCPSQCAPFSCFFITRHDECIQSFVQMSRKHSDRSSRSRSRGPAVGTFSSPYISINLDFVLFAVSLV